MSALNQLPPKKLAALVGGMFVVPLVLLGGYSALKQSSKSEVSGTIQPGGDPAAGWSPNRCQSGKLSEDAPPTQAQFHGVDLFDATQPDRRVRAIDDPEKGLVVTLRSGDAAPVIVDRQACSRFEVKLTQTGAMILDHWGFAGSLGLSCPEVVADVTFASCYDGT